MLLSFLSILTLFSASLPVLGVPTPLRDVTKYNGETTGRYIVRVKDGVSKADLVGQVRANASVTHEWGIVNGFVGHLDEHTLNTLRAHEDVVSISEDGIAHITTSETNAPWGLQRISQIPKLSTTNTDTLTFNYTYTATGSGVDIYIVDTGIFVEHSEFNGRAKWGMAVGSFAMVDGNGHGTHCAGVAAGTQYGVAKQASLIAVKAMSDTGSGAISDIITGMDWVLTQVQSTKRPSIVSMSLVGGLALDLDAAVKSLTDAGIHVAVAAGNNDNYADFLSPARAPSAITVGAMSIEDAKADFSNYGNVLDVFAPGVNVISAWIGSTDATLEASGTSMATPHVAGLMAYLISRDKNVSPSTMSTKIASSAVQGALTGIPSGTPNLIAQIGH
ncbi:hypothetical protein AMATHDRAFT_6424 [Amanita thiersii Skay4041]|uniref:Peptidase S8/S53 domain-containing protein n=1 Tax=Amanita thiersii Skay4041 TaxID=703135 RepID=A0A2A9NJB0_9AGAR|nr:hypothetical protein AMATHDRAFT_6424 [Amanita thiersii Skay4041]